MQARCPRSDLLRQHFVVNIQQARDVRTRRWRIGPEAVVRGFAHSVGGLVVQQKVHLVGEVVDVLSGECEASFAFHNLVLRRGAVGSDDRDSSPQRLDRRQRIDFVPDRRDRHRPSEFHFFEDLVAIDPASERRLFVADVLDGLHQWTVAENPNLGSDFAGGFDENLRVLFDREPTREYERFVLRDVDSRLVDARDRVAHHVNLGVLGQILAERVEALLAEDAEVVDLARHSGFALDCPAIHLGPLGHDGSALGAMGAKALYGSGA